MPCSRVQSKRKRGDTAAESSHVSQGVWLMSGARKASMRGASRLGDVRSRKRARVRVWDGSSSACLVACRESEASKREKCEGARIRKADRPAARAQQLETRLGQARLSPSSTNSFRALYSWRRMSAQIQDGRRRRSGRRPAKSGRVELPSLKATRLVRRRSCLHFCLQILLNAQTR